MLREKKHDQNEKKKITEENPQTIQILGAAYKNVKLSMITMLRKTVRLMDI